MNKFLSIAFLLLLSLSKVTGETVELRSFSADIPLENRAHSLEARTFYLDMYASGWILDVGMSGDWVLGDNGCLWKVLPGEEYLVLSWWPGDTIYITQSDCSLTRFILVNESRGYAVHVFRETAPDSYYYSVRRLIDMDPFLGYIHLDDGSWWYVPGLDAVYYHWAVGDVILIGLNSDYSSTMVYPYLLINVSVDPYALNREEWVIADLQ